MEAAPKAASQGDGENSDWRTVVELAFLKMVAGTTCQITCYPENAIWGWLSPMNASDAYRVRAAELLASARKERRRELAEELDALARAYLILAEMAERSSPLDLAHETPIKKS
jgi:hypothetical protein